MSTNTPESARKFVNEWLWESPDRQTEGMPWLSQYIRDAAVMAKAYSDQQTSELERQRDAAVTELKELREAADSALDAMMHTSLADSNAADELRTALAATKISALSTEQLSGTDRNMPGKPKEITAAECGAIQCTCPEPSSFGHEPGCPQLAHLATLRSAIDTPTPAPATQDQGAVDAELRRVQAVAGKEVQVLQAALALAAAKRKETAKDFETAFRLVRQENDQLRADSERLSKERDEAREKLTASLGFATEALGDAYQSVSVSVRENIAGSIRALRLDLAASQQREKALREAVQAFLAKAKVYGLAGATNHPAVRVEVKELTLGDFYALSAALK